MSAIDPKTRIKVGIAAPQIKWIAGRNANLTVDQVKAIIQIILEETLKEVTFELEIWINSKVPKRTGQLRDSLIKNLHSSRVQGAILRIILGTHINYAEDVNKMATRQVRHSGEIGYAYYYGHYGRIVLNDPQAIGGFFDAMLKYTKERVLYHLAVLKARYSASTSITAVELRRVKTT